MMIEFTCEVCNAVSLKVEIVHVDIQTLTVVNIKLLSGVLQQEGGFSNTSGALDANQPVVPVDLVHKGSTNWCIDMLHKVPMCPEKSLHLP
jgi:hypothetical protein